MCGSASLYIKTLCYFVTVLALSAAATVANVKIRYDAKTPQFAIFGTRVICVFYSNQNPNFLHCVSGGHYTAYGLNALNDQWYEFDDQYVTEVDVQQVENCEAYVLFYR